MIAKVFILIISFTLMQTDVFGLNNGGCPNASTSAPHKETKKRTKKRKRVQVPAAAGVQSAIPPQSRRGGGCDALALVTLGVFQDFEEACECMNEEIDVVWERKKKRFSSVTREEVGVNDSHWPAQTLANVCKLKEFSCKRLTEIGKVVF